MKALRATLAALLMMAMLAFPAFAQDGKAGAGDDQQVPDNQQTGGGKATVTKTFELTLNGTVPEDRAFAVFYGTRDQFEGLFESESEEPPFEYILFCGQPEDAKFADTVISDEDCVGDGNTYRAEVELPQGTELFFSFATAVETDLSTAEFFHGNVGTLFETGELTGEPEVLDTDMTNTAWYTFGKDTGAGDDQQDTGAGKDTGAGDEQEVPDNQQTGGGKDTGAGDEQETPDNQQEETPDTGTGAGNDQQDDVQDDQQGEMPEELPDTGAGGLAGGLPLGSAAAGASLLAASAYGVIRRR